MALPNWQRTVVTQSGDVVPNAEVQVVVEATGLDADIFSDRAGTTPRSNPFFTGSNGLAQFYAAPGEYRITATGPSGTITWRYEVLLGTATDNTFNGDNTFSGDTTLDDVDMTGTVDVSGTFDVSGTIGATLSGFIAAQAVPPGAVLAYASTTAPSGYLLCDGAAVSRTTYADLFAAISTTWGVGDGSTTFNLPDGRGGVLRGTGTGTVNGRDKVGPAVGSKQEDQMQGHWHTVTDGTFQALRFENRGGGSSPNITSTESVSGTLEARELKTDGTNGAPRTGTETRPYSIGVQWIIKV